MILRTYAESALDGPKIDLAAFQDIIAGFVRMGA